LIGGEYSKVLGKKPRKQTENKADGVTLPLVDMRMNGS